MASGFLPNPQSHSLDLVADSVLPQCRSRGATTRRRGRRSSWSREMGLRGMRSRGGKDLAEYAPRPRHTAGWRTSSRRRATATPVVRRLSVARFALTRVDCCGRQRRGSARRAHAPLDRSAKVGRRLNVKSRRVAEIRTNGVGGLTLQLRVEFKGDCWRPICGRALRTRAALRSRRRPTGRIRRRAWRRGRAFLPGSRASCRFWCVVSPGRQ